MFLTHLERLHATQFLLRKIEQLEKLVEQLKNLDAIKTDFVTIASNEVRTPLAQMRGYAEAIDRLNDQRSLTTDQISEMLTKFRKATDRLEWMISDLLDVSTLGVDALDLHFAKTTIESVVRLAIEPFSENIKEHKQELKAHGLRPLPPIEADMRQLESAFRNVVNNAVRYTPDGGHIDISAQLQVNQESNIDEIMVIIQDTGVGIDPENHDLIFTKFFRVDEPGLHDGLPRFLSTGPGLGLTIARAIITGHGGRIWVESPGYDPEKFPGTTVYIVIPINVPKDAKRIMPLLS